MTSSVSQHTKLKEMINYIAEHSPFYKRMFKDHDINLNNIHSIEDLQKIPFTNKEDLQKYNSDFICVPKTKLVDYVTTSGTTGKPVTLALTDHDLDRLALNEYNSYKTAGLTSGDVIQLMTTIDRRFYGWTRLFFRRQKIRCRYYSCWQWHS